MKFCNFLDFDFDAVTNALSRMLVTFDTELRPLPVSVRVGNAVDVVGQVKRNPFSFFVLK